MIRFAALFTERRDARAVFTRVFGWEAPVTTPGLTAAWLPSDAIDVVRHGSVTCVVAGQPEMAADIAAAYSRDALDLETLPGTFTVLLWDVERQRGLVATDRLGVLAPVFRRVGNEVAVALEPRDLLRLLPVAPAPDERSLVRWLASGSIDPGTTLYAGVERLPGGHVLKLTDGRWERRRYRSFRYGGTLAAPREELEQVVRATIGRAVASRLGKPGTTGVLLSGGLDSTVVATTAAEIRERLPSYSLIFPSHDEVDERALIEGTAAELGLDSTLLASGSAALIPAAAAFIDAWCVPPASPTLAIQLPLLRRAHDSGATQLLDGQGGDELFGAPLYLLADRVRRGRLWRARDLAHRIPGFPAHLRKAVGRRALREFGLKGALPHSAHRLPGRGPGLPPWLTPAAARGYREGVDPWAWKRADGPRWWAALLDAVTEQRERAGAHEYLRRRNALAGADGGHPLLQDLDLIELALKLPPELAFDPTFDRPLLRSAIPTLPEAIRRRTQKAYFTTLFLEAIEIHDASEIRQLLTAKDGAVRAYTQPEVVRARLLDAPTERRGEHRAWALWRLAVAELWLRRLG